MSVEIIDQCVAQGVPLRPRVRRAARQPLVRRRPGLPHLLRARPDRPAAPARRVPGARRAGPARHRQAVPRTEMLDLVLLDGRAAGSWRATWSPARSRPTRPRRRARHRRLLQRLLPLDQRQGLQHHRHLARPQGARLGQPLLHPDPPHLHPARAASTNRSSP